MFDTRRGDPDFDRDGTGGYRRSTGSLLPVAVVVGFGMLVIVGLVGLTGLAGLYIVLALMGVLGFAAFHYLLWGWWLTKKLRQQQPPDGSDLDE